MKMRPSRLYERLFWRKLALRIDISEAVSDPKRTPVPSSDSGHMSDCMRLSGATSLPETVEHDSSRAGIIIKGFEYHFD